MTLNDLKKELEEDTRINLTDLQWESANNPVLYGKWLRYMYDFRVQLRGSLNKKYKAQKERLDYYTGRGDEICLDQYAPSEMKTVLTGDHSLIRIETEIEIVSIMMDFCKGALDAIKQRGFSIKAIIEQRQLEAGK